MEIFFNLFYKSHDIYHSLQQNLSIIFKISIQFNRDTYPFILILLKLCISISIDNFFFLHIKHEISNCSFNKIIFSSFILISNLCHLSKNSFV